MNEHNCGQSYVAGTFHWGYLEQLWITPVLHSLKAAFGIGFNLKIKKVVSQVYTTE